MNRLAVLCALLSGCYEPEAVDCTVECSGPGDCADGQVCGSDHFCAAPAVAGMCNASDEPQVVSLGVTIEGDGKVNIDHVGMCDSAGPTQGTCMFDVKPGVMQQLKAIESPEREFISWTSTCIGTSATCTLTPVTSLTQVGAKFQ